MIWSTAETGTRDASMWNSPDRYKTKKYHIRDESGHFALCGAKAVLCRDGLPKEKVPHSLRCKKRGCLEQWKE